MKTALLLIDVQAGFLDPYWGQRNNPGAEGKMAQLLAHWREKGWPVVHVQHLSRSSASPLRPGQPGVEIQEGLRPLSGERIFQKQVHAAFVGTGLERYLRTEKIRHLVVAGLSTDHCVSTTARLAADLGFRVTVVADATATFDRPGEGDLRYDAEIVHQLALASLRGEFAEIEETAATLTTLSGP